MAKRDYKDEYDKFQRKKIPYRVAHNRRRRQLILKGLKKGDPRDLAKQPDGSYELEHKSKNRGDPHPVARPKKKGDDR